MKSITPAIVCVAVLVDPHPGPGAEEIAGILAIAALVVWVLETTIAAVESFRS